MNNTKFFVVANPNCPEESAEFTEDEIDRIEIDSDGTLTIYTTDDSTCTYLNDGWLRITNEITTDRTDDFYQKLATRWQLTRQEAKIRYLQCIYDIWDLS